MSNQTYRQKIEPNPKDNRKTFVLEGRLVFKANDIIDAFTQLAVHFDRLANEVDAQVALDGTDIKIEPIT